MAIHRPIDPEEEFNASVALYKTSPIAYYYGSSDITHNKKVYASLLSTLASKVLKKLEDPAVRPAGIIVDTPSQFMEQNGLSMLTTAIEDFKSKSTRSTACTSNSLKLEPALLFYSS